MVLLEISSCRKTELRMGTSGVTVSGWASDQDAGSQGILKVKHRNEIENVLTPEQKVKFYGVYDYCRRGRGHMKVPGKGMTGF